jgi:4-hydroxy-tetrahydrodipicolinate synthase
MGATAHDATRWISSGASDGCGRIASGCTGLRKARKVILYDVPSRTACGLADETIARLAELPRVIGLKDAAGDTTRAARLRSLLGTEFRLLCGDDALALPYVAQGGDGCISVTSNVTPGLCRNMFLAWKQGQSVRAQRLARAAAPLTTALFRESNPVPVKYALALLGLMSPAVRLPLVELSPHLRTELGEVLLRLCDEYSEYMIGNTLEGGAATRSPASSVHFIIRSVARGRCKLARPAWRW